MATAYGILSAAAASMEGAFGMLLPTCCFCTYLCIGIVGGTKEDLVGISFIFTLVGEGELAGAYIHLFSVDWF